MCLYFLSSILWHPLRFPHKHDVRCDLPPVVCRRAYVLFVLICFTYTGVLRLYIICRVFYKKQALLTPGEHLRLSRVCLVGSVLLIILVFSFVCVFIFLPICLLVLCWFCFVFFMCLVCPMLPVYLFGRSLLPLRFSLQFINVM